MESWSAMSARQCFHVMGKNKLFFLLAAVSSLSAFAQAAAGAVLAQILQMTLGFSKHDLVCDLCHSFICSQAYHAILLRSQDMV